MNYRFLVALNRECIDHVMIVPYTTTVALVMILALSKQDTCALKEKHFLLIITHVYPGLTFYVKVMELRTMISETTATVTWMIMIMKQRVVMTMNTMKKIIWWEAN